MKHFWALPAFLRLVIANQHSFSVLDDLFAFPQYQVVVSDSAVSEEYAASQLSSASGSSSPSSSTQPSSETPSVALSHQDPNTIGNGDQQRPYYEPADTDKHTYEQMVLNDQRYLCRIPVITAFAAKKNTTSRSADEEEKELVRASDRGWQLLKGLEGNCLYYFSGWWTYKFCYGDGVQQFHQLPPSRGVPVYPPVEDKGVASFMLGRFESDGRKVRGRLDGRKGDTEEGKKEGEEKALARLETKGEMRYLVQKLEGGTTCDLTGKDRKVEVQFHCNPQSADRINLIKEVSTCTYLMVIHTPRLCNDVAFLPPKKDAPNYIGCDTILPASQISTWEEAREIARDKKLDELLAREAEKELGQSPRIIVGGVEVGAHALLPKDAPELEKGVIVGGGKEVYIGTVAKSDGTIRLSKEELASMNIKDPKEVEAVKKQVDRMAKGKGWKLDVVDTPRGREFRGVIDADGRGFDEDKEERERSDKGAGEKGREERKDGGRRKEDAETEAENVGSEERYKDEL